jgi:hypothetical protein
MEGELVVEGHAKADVSRRAVGGGAGAGGDAIAIAIGTMA